MPGKTERNLEILGNYTHLDKDLLVQKAGWLPDCRKWYPSRING